MSSYKQSRIRVQKHFHEPSMAKQSFKDECDINTIMSRFEKNGLLDHIKEYQGQYIVCPPQEDFHAAMNLVADAKSMFQKLPAQIRADFNNDPSAFLDFVDDPESRERMIKYGLIDAPEAPEAQEQKEAPPTEPIGPAASAAS